MFFKCFWYFFDIGTSKHQKKYQFDVFSGEKHFEQQVEPKKQTHSLNNWTDAVHVAKLFF